MSTSNNPEVANRIVRQSETLDTIIKFIPWLAVLMGVPLYLQRTYVQKEEFKDVITGITKYTDDRHSSAVTHSDGNRAAVEGKVRELAAGTELQLKEVGATLSSIRDWLRQDEQRKWEDQRWTRRPQQPRTAQSY